MNQKLRKSIKMYMRVTNTVPMQTEDKNKTLLIKNCWSPYLAISLCKGIATYLESSSDVSSEESRVLCKVLSSTVLIAGTQSPPSVSTWKHELEIHCPPPYHSTNVNVNWATLGSWSVLSYLLLLVTSFCRISCETPHVPSLIRTIFTFSGIH